MRQPLGGLLGPVRPHVGAEHQHRPLGGREQRGRRRDVVGVGLGPGTRRRRRHRHLGPAEEVVHRHVEEHRTPVRRRRERQPGIDPVGDLVGGLDGLGQLGDRGEQRRVVQLLQRSPTPAPSRRPAAHDQQRRPRERRLRDRGYAVRHPGTGGQHRETRRAGQLAGGLGGEHGRLLVPDVDQPHRGVRLDRPVVHREHVRARQREHGLDAVRPRDADREVAPVALLGGGHGLGAYDPASTSSRRGPVSQGSPGNRRFPRVTTQGEPRFPT